MYCSKDFGYYFLLICLNISRRRDMWRDARTQRKENRKARWQKWHKLSENVLVTRQEVDAARQLITKNVDWGAGKPNACFVRYSDSLDIQPDYGNQNPKIEVTRVEPCDDLGENGRCQKECASGEDECPMKAQNAVYVDALERLQSAKDARHDFVWEMSAINGVRIDKLWLLTWNIWQKRRDKRRLNSKVLDTFELIHVVPVNRDRPIDRAHRTHCIIGALKSGEKDDECEKYPKGEDWKTKMCHDHTCAGCPAQEDYIITKRNLGNVKEEYQNLLAQRRAMLRQMFGVKDKVKK